MLIFRIELFCENVRYNVPRNESKSRQKGSVQNPGRQSLQYGPWRGTLLTNPVPDSKNVDLLDGRNRACNCIRVQCISHNHRKTGLQKKPFQFPEKPVFPLQHL